VPAKTKSTATFSSARPSIDSDWFHKNDDVRWQFGGPHATNVWTHRDEEVCTIGSQKVEYLIHNLS
jgi:hypothetical protein